ncbi:MAG: 2Fe-2S iron-sulfur cluster binding domain-containing protein [Gemmatimonadetes bacterium]|nr:2Fe-2S iron-sulfur cluster binding domain-containing protein [Gemmatimonadota bacterium]
MSESATKPMVTATLDGRTVTVPKGTTILQAAETVGVWVPHYCYHPGLSSPAQCRLCLVEVQGAPKLAPSCVTELQEGQVVHTESPKAKEMRQGVLEFYLANHPLDCPVCDQSGECKLQDYVHAEGRVHGRSREPKRGFGRDDYGRDVLFYGDRCGRCTRCVRFMDEVAKDPRLTVVERGNRSVIDTFFEEGLQGSAFAGNIVDICPVGALVSKDFLHKARAWDLDHSPSVCPNCSQGCNIDLHVRDDVVQRLRPRANLEVNHHWMCDYGRHRYEWMNRQDRIEVPVVGSSADGVALEWGLALRQVADRLANAPQPVMAVASASSSNEDLGALAHLVRALGGGEIVFRSERAEKEIPLPGFPTLTRRYDLVPNRMGAEILGMTRVGKDDGTGGLEGWAAHRGTLLVLGDELRDVGVDFGPSAGLYVYLGSYPTPAASSAHAVLPVTTFAEGEGTFANVEGRVQRFWPGVRPPGLARPAWLVLAALVERLGGAAVPESAEAAFLRVAELAPELQGLTYEAIGTQGALLNEPVALPGSRS